MIRYSDADLIREIRRVIKQENRGVTPSPTEFAKLARVNLATIKARFGSYAQAIAAAGFTYTSPRDKYTGEKVKANLHEVLKRAGGYWFSYNFYRQHGGLYSANTIKSLLGVNWAGAMMAIGAKKRPHISRISLHAQRRRPLATLAEADLFNEIGRVWQLKGRRPTYNEFRLATEIGTKVYERRFGSWSKAIGAYCRARGIRVQGKPATHVTREILLDELRAVQGKRPRDLLTYDSYKKNGGTYSIGTFQAHFGSWTKAVQTVGNVSGKQAKYSKDELFNEMQRMWEKLGRQPSYRDMWQQGSISPKSFITMFGTWTKAVHAFCNDRNSAPVTETIPKQPSAVQAPTDVLTMQLPVSSPSTTSASEVIVRRTGRSISDRLRFSVLQRDKFTCQACGRSPAKGHVVDLQVDHIRAWANGGETVLENLQTLCAECNRGKSNF